MDTFFSNFPNIVYNGVNTVDITKNVDIASNSYNNPYLFSDYTINESIRSDQLSNKLYGDPYAEWVIFLSNQMTDPYSWYMNQDEFYDYINQKYGDWFLAQQKIKYYMNNWYDDDLIMLDPAGYESLDPSLSKYWEPIFGDNNTIIGYKRLKVDWVINTNHLVQLNFTIPVPTFTIDEIVNVQYDVGIIGNGQVAFTSNNALYFQHVTGNYQPVNGFINATAFSIFGQESDENITISTANQVSVSIIDVFPSNSSGLQSQEYTYYEAITYFDDENIKNENNKTIAYLNNNYIDSIVTQLRNNL